MDLIGEQDEKIYVELANAKLATLGIEPAAVFAALAQQNAVAATGSFETPTERIYIRATGALDSVESVKAHRHPRQRPPLPLSATSRPCIAASSIRRSRACATWASEALGIAVSMVPRGDIIALGHALDAQVDAIEKRAAGGPRARRASTTSRATVKRSVRRIHALARRGGGDRAGRELRLARACAPGSSSRCRSRSRSR